MNIEQIKQAIDNGCRVFWKSENYEVIKRNGIFKSIGGPENVYLIICHSNNDIIGLHGQVGTEYENVLNGNEDDFYIHCTGENTIYQITFEHFIIAMLWSSVDDDEDPMDQNYSIQDFDSGHLFKLYLTVKKWVDDNHDLIEQLPENYGYDQLGHDLWLTSVGHGVGFWDRGLNALGDKLTEKCEGLFSDVYIGDDNKVWAFGYEN